MSSIGTGYDLAAATFSPDGRIFQVEYAAKAVESSSTVIALASKHGILVAVDQPVPSKLSFAVSTNRTKQTHSCNRFNFIRFKYLKDSNSRIMDVNDQIGLVGSGLYPDMCSLCDYARTEANNYLKEYHKPIGVRKLANTVKLI
jgi:20S proteasome subunit alpha 7